MTMDEQFMVKQQTSDLNLNSKKKKKKQEQLENRRHVATCRQLALQSTQRDILPPFRTSLCKVMQNGNGQQQRQLQLVKSIAHRIPFLYPTMSCVCPCCLSSCAAQLSVCVCV
ncbi:hypothetical protein ACLKA7_016189 [Drosophila subpalustris]